MNLTLEITITAKRNDGFDKDHVDKTLTLDVVSEKNKYYPFGDLAEQLAIDAIEERIAAIKAEEAEEQSEA